MNELPLISIITPCLNRAALISEAIESVRNQEYPYIEHIVVDGGSTDGTLDVLRRYPHLQLISEPDQSMYEALNKGIRSARGEIIGHLNSDDLYPPNIFSCIVNELVASPDLDAIAGAAIIAEMKPDEEKVMIKEYPPVEKGDLIRRTATSTPIFNAWFFRRRVFDKAGFFNPQYRIAGDSEFMLRLGLAGIHYEAIHKTVYQYRLHAGSKTISNDAEAWAKTEREIMDISESFLEAGISGEAEHYCKLWYMRSSESVLKFSLKKGNLPDAWSAMWRGWKYNLWSPLILFRRSFIDIAILPVRLIKRRLQS